MGHSYHQQITCYGHIPWYLLLPNDDRRYCNVAFWKTRNCNNLQLSASAYTCCTLKLTTWSLLHRHCWRKSWRCMVYDRDFRRLSKRCYAHAGCCTQLNIECSNLVGTVGPCGIMLNKPSACRVDRIRLAPWQKLSDQRIQAATLSILSVRYSRQ